MEGAGALSRIVNEEIIVGVLFKSLARARGIRYDGLQLNVVVLQAQHGEVGDEEDAQLEHVVQ